MTNVSCSSTYCLHNENEECQKDSISLFDDWCSDFTPYYNQPDYQEKFWIALKSKKDNNKIVKSARKGKKIELLGITFYTSDDDRYPDVMDLTEARTGIRCGNGKRVRENIEFISEGLTEYPDVICYDFEEI